MDKDAFFNTHYSDFCFWIERRRHKWRATSIMEFEDVKSMLLTRIYRQLDRYNEELPLDRWTNTLISHAICNLLRDLVYKDMRPCVRADAYGSPCAFNLGGNTCSKTPSKIQCSECWAYAAWEKKKHSKFAISTPLSIENHTDESHSIQSDFLDIEGAKAKIDASIQRRLNKDEAKIYRLLFIQNLEEDEVGKKMGYKKQANSDVRGYLQIRAAKLKIKEVAKQIISEEGLVL